MIKKTFLIGTLVTSIFLLSGCGAWQNNMGKALQGLSMGNFVVTVWSGGLPATTYYVKDGYVNADETGGWFFFVEGTNILLR